MPRTNSSTVSSGVPAKVPGTAAFSKFMAALQVVAQADGPTTLAHLIATLGFPRPTVYRILEALVAEGMLMEDVRTRSYQLGPRLIALASKSWEKSSLREAALEPLQRLRDATRETIHLAVPVGLGMVYIEKLESPQTVRMTSRIGAQVMLHASSVGKAFLSTLAEPEREKIMGQLDLVSLTPHTIRSLSGLREEIEQVRRRRYAEDREETELQIHCYGAPITGPDGRAVACVSISIPMYRKNRKVQDTYVKPLLGVCRSISEKLPYLR